MPKRSGRDPGSLVAEPVEALDGDRAGTARADQQNAVKALGARQELLGGALDEIGRMSGYLENLDEMVGELRRPLDEEMVTHRHELGELVTPPPGAARSDRRPAATVARR